MKRALIILLALSGTLASCYYDIEEDIYPGNGACDTNGATYSSSVLPALQSNGCLGCHSGSTPSGNISLEGYNNVRTAALNGTLYGAISFSPGYPPMPQGGNKMSACNINRIKAWIDAGAPNN
ncbi:MAG: hypothetical protein JNK14_12530 [Chitinophagaceae bacterium]|nr:hypothetical protein [Chitinophagaceae bacterium]